MNYSTFLRTVLKLDCASCLATAALLAPGAGTLSGPLGIPAALLGAAGLALIPIGLFIGRLGVRREGPASLVGLVIAGNLGWVAASLAVTAALPSILPLGAAFVIGQALVVLVLAMLEWRGLRQGRAAQA
ncbi:MAG: hypothetical protein ACR2FK_07400 [Sphingomicrobium sp.]